MRKAVLTRGVSKDDGVFGTLRADRFQCFTAERPWLDNQNNVSCVPTGTYKCRFTKSPRLGFFTYEVLQVVKRNGIRIHSANFPSQLFGCIALGEKFGTMDGKRCVMVSRPAVRAFESAMLKEDFLLEVK